MVLLLTKAFHNFQLSIGTVSEKKEFLIDKKKLKKIRTFRDQLMTVAGGTKLLL
jgi:hypothetical protein